MHGRRAYNFYDDYGLYSGSSSDGGRTAGEDGDHLRAADMVVIFVKGVAILASLIVVVYAIVLLRRRLRMGGQVYIEESGVERDAGLTGMTVPERRAVLEKILVGKPYHTHTNCDSRITSIHVEPSNNPSSSVGGSNTIVDEEMDVETGDGDHNVEEGSSQVNVPSVKNSPSTDNESAESPNSEADLEDEKQETKGSRMSEDTPQIKNDSTTQCAICIDEYEEYDEVVCGASCPHMFHLKCVLEWLERHEGCPCCRKDMVTSSQMREAARGVLDEERMATMLALKRSSFSYDAGVRAAPSLDHASDLELENM